MKRKLAPEPKQTIDTEQSPKLNKPEHEQNINLKSDEEPNNPFNDFIDERELISHNAFGDKEMKIKILEISDEVGQTSWKFGDRVKINKILIIDVCLEFIRYPFFISFVGTHLFVDV